VLLGKKTQKSMIPSGCLVNTRLLPPWPEAVSLGGDADPFLGSAECITRKPGFPAGVHDLGVKKGPLCQ
jgi:hypothetical protein